MRKGLRDDATGVLCGGGVADGFGCCSQKEAVKETVRQFEDALLLTVCVSAR